MTKLMILVAWIVGAVLLLAIGERLTSDAIAMGVGVVFGIMASVPFAMLLVWQYQRNAVSEPPQIIDYDEMARNGTRRVRLVGLTAPYTLLEIDAAANAERIVPAGISDF